MRAYYFDNLPGDQRLPHDSQIPVPTPALHALGVLSYHIPVPSHQAAIDAIAEERGYRNRDTISVSKEGLGEAYEARIRGFYEEWVLLMFDVANRCSLMWDRHMHEDEEIRYILDGSGFFDVRGTSHPHPFHRRL